MQDPCSCGVCLTPKVLQGDRYALLPKARLYSLNTNQLCGTAVRRYCAKFYQPRQIEKN